MTRRNRKSDDIQELCFEDHMEENGIVDGEPTGGDIVKAFSFVSQDEPVVTEHNTVLTQESASNIFNDEKIYNSAPLLDNRKLKKEVNGRTPPIDGEPFDINRSYKLRKSTARMLNEIKSIHPDVNVYMNTIVDAALRHYYAYIFNKNN